MTDFDARREMLRRRREMNHLLQRSSLGNVWVRCRIHGRQARDPLTDRCIRCRTPVKAWLPEGVEVYPDQKRFVLLGDDLIIYDGYACLDGLTNFTVLCGENGWWVDIAIQVAEEDFYCMPCDWRYGDHTTETPTDLADLIAEVSCRTRPVPEWVDREIGLAQGPGVWWGFENWEWS